MPIDYKNGKIYSLQCLDGHYYIGSTCCTLSLRLSHHIFAINNNKYKAKKSYFNKVPIEEITIELIEDFPCSNKKELNIREDYYIRKHIHDPLCLNTYGAHLSDEDKREYDKEYYKNNIDRIKITVKEYYEKNKDEIKDYHTEYNAINKDRIDAYHAEYRVKYAEKRREYSKKYNKEHSEERKIARKESYEKNKEKELARNRAYALANVDKLKEYKKIYAEKQKLIREANMTEILAERARKAEERARKTAERKACERIIATCECGGTYQMYQKNRHFASKKHISFINKEKI